MSDPRLDPPLERDSVGEDLVQDGAEPELADLEDDEPEDEKQARSEKTLAEMVNEDLGDPETPSVRSGTGDPVAGSFEVPYEPLP